MRLFLALNLDCLRRRFYEDVELLKIKTQITVEAQKLSINI